MLKVVNQDEKPTMPYVYEAMDEAKLGIKALTTSYKKILGYDRQKLEQTIV